MDNSNVVIAAIYTVGNYIYVIEYDKKGEVYNMIAGDIKSRAIIFDANIHKEQYIKL